MGQKNAKQTQGRRTYNKMNKATKVLYYKAEFHSMGDVLGDGHLNEREFCRLMTLLGLPEVNRAGPILFNGQSKKQGCGISEDEYVALMSDPSVDSKTCMWRKLFAQFDTDGSGWASRDDVVEGLRKMGIPVNDDMKAKITAMDSDKDGRICYGDFLKMQLLKK